MINLKLFRLSYDVVWLTNLETRHVYDHIDYCSQISTDIPMFKLMFAPDSQISQFLRNMTCYMVISFLCDAQKPKFQIV